MDKKYDNSKKRNTNGQWTNEKIFELTIGKINTNKDKIQLFTLNL